MSTGDRSGKSAGQGLGVFIAVTVAFVGLVIWAGYRQDHSDEREYAAHSDREQAVASCAGSIEGVADPACVNEAIDAQYHKQHEAADLRAQQEMAEWALLMLFATTAGVVYVALTLETTRQATKVAKDTIRVTQEIGEKQVQSYLIANSGEMRLRRHFDSKTMQAHFGISCNLNVVNKGQSPGRKVELTYEIWAIKEIDESGRAHGFLNFEGSTFCADVGPGAQEIAIISSDLLSPRQFSELEQSYSWIDIRGEMVWLNEFGHEQRQAINLATPKFWYHDVFTSGGSFNDAGKLPLVGIGRRAIALISAKPGG